MHIEIRKGVQADRDALAQFQVEMAWETERYKLDLHQVLNGVEAVLNNEHLGIYYVAVLNKEIIASLLTTYEWSDWRNGTVLWIQSVYVNPEYRKRGIYARLYSHVKSLVETDARFVGIRLYVDRTNTAAQEVYARLGMNGDHYRVFEWMKA
jgi:predicted GNAT family acetyltransferase